MVIFTPEELDGFTMKQLRILATYYKLSYNKTTTKKELIVPLLEILYRPDLPDEYGNYAEEAPKKLYVNGTPVSVRVKRIYDMNKKGDTNA